MSIYFLGHSTADLKSGDNSDKVWGVADLDNTFVVFFGKRTAQKFNTKVHEDKSTVDTLIKSKVKKGYHEVAEENYGKILGPDYDARISLAVWTA